MNTAMIGKNITNLYLLALLRAILANFSILISSISSPQPVMLQIYGLLTPRGASCFVLLQGPAVFLHKHMYHDLVDRRFLILKAVR